jgi:NitT/TauT family transport system substrate-binding protein
VNQLVTALQRHEVSAIVATDPQITQAETRLGAVELLDSCSGVTADLPLAGYFSMSAFARAHPAALADFRAAILAAQASSGNRSTLQPVLRAEGMTAEETALFNTGQYPAFVSVGQIQGVADLMYTSGMISSPVSVRSMLAK